MRTSQRWYRSGHLAVLACLLLSSIHHERALAQSAGPTIIPMLQEELGLNESQVRGALGALLVFVNDELSKADFDKLAKTIPNAERIMQDVKQQGIVTRPLDDIEDYQASLESLGIGQPLASQFAPAVLKALTDSGHTLERDILWRALN